MPWKIDMEPEGKNEDNRNEGAMIVYLTDGSKREEHSAVAFARRHSRNPDLTFDEALERQAKQARAVARAKNELDEMMPTGGRVLR